MRSLAVIYITVRFLLFIAKETCGILLLTPGHEVGINDSSILPILLCVAFNNEFNSSLTLFSITGGFVH